MIEPNEVDSSSPPPRVSQPLVRIALLFCLLCAGTALGACNGSKSAERSESLGLSLISNQSLDIDEPSGLAIDSENEILWAVGNSPSRVFKLTLDADLLETLSFKGDDLEGIAFDSFDSTLWVVEEQRREVIHLDTLGNELSRISIELDGKRNSGLEGISVDGERNLYLLNEKSPGLLFSIDPDYVLIWQHEFDFARDYSGLAFDSSHRRFWITSHEEKMVYLWDRDRGLIGQFEVPFSKIEGVAVDADSGRLYIVSEGGNSLLTYSIPQQLR